MGVRTSLDLPDETIRRLKMRAVECGVTLEEFLRTLVEEALDRPRATLPEHCTEFTILRSKEPGTLDPTNVEIEELLT